MIISLCLFWMAMPILPTEGVAKLVRKVRTQPCSRYGIHCCFLLCCQNKVDYTVSTIPSARSRVVGNTHPWQHERCEQRRIFLKRKIRPKRNRRASSYGNVRSETAKSLFLCKTVFQCIALV